MLLYNFFSNYFVRKYVWNKVKSLNEKKNEKKEELWIWIAAIELLTRQKIMNDTYKPLNINSYSTFKNINKHIICQVNDSEANQTKNIIIYTINKHILSLFFISFLMYFSCMMVSWVFYQLSSRTSNGSKT